MLAVPQEDRYYRIADEPLVRDVLVFLSTACQRDRGGGFAQEKTFDAELVTDGPEPISFNIYSDDEYIGPGWSKLWDRMLKEGQRIPPPSEG